jgi:flagellar hook protein FlgE
MRSQQAFMDIVANNISNVSTTGFKAQRARFSDMLYQTLSGGSAGSSSAGGTDPSQIGLGVTLAGTDNTMGQGALRATGGPLDLAVEGDGFFVLKDASGNTFYSRDGAFAIDANKNLVNPSTGMLVQKVGGGNIQIDMTQFSSISVGADGTINGVPVGGGSVQNVAQIQLASFPNEGGLDRAGDNTWQASAASGAAATNAPQSNGLGSIRAGVLESSNTDLAQEFSNMIVAQRGFEANSKVITAADEVLQTLVNIIH